MKQYIPEEEYAHLRLRFDALAVDSPHLLHRGPRNWRTSSSFDGVAEEMRKDGDQPLWLQAPATMKDKRSVWKHCVVKRGKFTREVLISQRKQDLIVANKWLSSRRNTDENEVAEIRRLLGLDLSLEYENGPLGGSDPDTEANTGKRKRSASANTMQMVSKVK